jgi:hypothetical protein
MISDHPQHLPAASYVPVIMINMFSGKFSGLFAGTLKGKILGALLDWKTSIL